MPKRDRKIKQHKWYIVQMFKKNLNGNWQLMRRDYGSKAEAIIGIKINFPGKEIYYEVVKGRVAIEFGMEFTKRMEKHIKKYEYPDDVEETYQARKSFRTKLRRHKRGYKNSKNDKKYKKAHRRRKRNK